MAEQKDKTVSDILKDDPYIRLGNVGEKIKLQVIGDPLSQVSRIGSFGSPVIDWKFRDEKGKEKIFTSGSLSFMRSMSKFKDGDWVILEAIPDRNKTGRKASVYLESGSPGDGFDLPEDSGEKETVSPDDIPF